mmetsp:Transcript_15404/g.46084  ORF Transcript_15404/g.46084 Transcript_15404/m.46084 type:complete len:211 (-) Transcript_15404:534-1166(-)
MVTVDPWPVTSCKDTFWNASAHSTTMLTTHSKTLFSTHRHSLLSTQRQSLLSTLSETVLSTHTKALFPSRRRSPTTVRPYGNRPALGCSEARRWISERWFDWRSSSAAQSIIADTLARASFRDPRSLLLSCTAAPCGFVTSVTLVCCSHLVETLRAARPAAILNLCSAPWIIHRTETMRARASVVRVASCDCVAVAPHECTMHEDVVASR